MPSTAAQKFETRSLLAASILGLYAAGVVLCPDLNTKLLLGIPLAVIPLIWWTLAKPAAWIALFLSTALLLPPFPFAFGNSGIHPSLFFVVLGLIAGCLRFDEWNPRLDPITRSLILFVAILLATVPMALFYSGERIAFESLMRIALFCIGPYIFLYIAYGPAASNFNGFAAVRFLFWAAVVCAAFACVDFYFQFPPPAGYGPQFIWLQSGIYRRAQGLFYEANSLGNFCTFFLTLIAVALFEKPSVPKPIGKIAIAAGGLTLTAALIFSFSRSSLLNLAVAICALLYLHRSRLRLRRLLVSLTLLAGCVAAVMSITFPVFAQLYWMRIVNSLLYFTEAPNAILSGRLETWAYLLRFVADHPLVALFGIGYKTLPYSDFVGKTVIADNTYLSMLVETGIAGLAAMLGLCFAILGVSRRAAASADSRTAFFGTWMFCFWCGEMVQMMSGDILTYWRVTPLFFAALAMAVRK